MPDRGSIDLHKFDTEIQVNVTINSNLLLDWVPFYHFIMVSENAKNVSQS